MSSVTIAVSQTLVLAEGYPFFVCVLFRAIIQTAFLAQVFVARLFILICVVHSGIMATEESSV